MDTGDGSSFFDITVEAPKICMKSNSGKIKAYFEDKWGEEGLLADKDYQSDLQKFSKISGKCFTKKYIF